MEYLAIVEWGWEGYEEFCRSRTSSPGFLGQLFNNLQLAALLTSFWHHWFNMTKRLMSLAQYDKVLSKFGQQQLVMVNYGCVLFIPCCHWPLHWPGTLMWYLKSGQPLENSKVEVHWVGEECSTQCHSLMVWRARPLECQSKSNLLISIQITSEKY